MQHQTSKTVLYALAAVALLIGCRTPADTAAECGAVEVPADPATQAPRPDETQASFHFPGNNPEQREFVLVHEDGRYEYAERWNFGVPKKGTVRSLDPRRKKDWEADLPIGKESTVEKDQLGGVKSDIPPRLKVDWDDELQGTFGWDWKVGCTMHVCTREDGGRLLPPALRGRRLHGNRVRAARQLRVHELLGRRPLRLVPDRLA